jgi:hypothetical protein
MLEIISPVAEDALDLLFKNFREDAAWTDQPDPALGS